MISLSMFLRRTFGISQLRLWPASVGAAKVSTLPASWAADVRQLHLWARSGQWQRYRDARVVMADCLLKRGRTLEALEHLLDAWFVDLNGPRNAQPPAEALLAIEAPAAQPARGVTNPRVLRQVRRTMRQLALEVDDVQALFFATASTTHRRYGLPLSPTRAWLVIGTHLLD